jgi:predicted RNA binding protein YcfA (HicA-like mRNA interferase family)
LKVLSGKEFVRLLERNGWTLERIQGSHHIFIKQGSTVRISVPVHGNRPLKIGLQSHLMKLAGLPKE